MNLNKQQIEVLIKAYTYLIQYITRHKVEGICTTIVALPRKKLDVVTGITYSKIFLYNHFKSIPRPIQAKTPPSAYYWKKGTKKPRLLFLEEVLADLNKQLTQINQT